MMIIRSSLLVVVCGIGVYFINSYPNLNDGTQSEKKLSAEQSATTLAKRPDIKVKVIKPQLNMDLVDNRLEVLPLMSSLTNADLIMSESLQNLHLKEFTEYLNGERASEHTTLAFYTDSRWYEFYKRLGYQTEDIDQLIVVRSQYLADISQSGKEYYYYRWSKAPHKMLSELSAYEVYSFLGDGEADESVLTSSISSVASKYGVSTSFVEKMAQKHLLESIADIESSSTIFRTLVEPQADEINFDSEFVRFLEEKAGYVKVGPATNEKPLYRLTGTH